MVDNMITGAETSAPFAIRSINTKDVFQMVRVLRSIGIQNMLAEVSGAVSKARWKRPEKYDKDGNLVPLKDEELTEGQLRQKEEAAKAREEAAMMVMGYLIDHIDACEVDICKLLAGAFGTTPEAIMEVSGIEFIQMLDAYINRDGFYDFFEAALRLLQRSGGRNS